MTPQTSFGTDEIATVIAELSEANKKELNDIVHTCEQIQSAAMAFSQSATNEKDKDWAAVTSDANRVSSRPLCRNIRSFT